MSFYSLFKQIESGQKATISSILIFFGLLFITPAFGRTINNLFPVLFPLFPPQKRPFTNRTHLFRQFIFIDHFHGVWVSFVCVRIT